MKGFDMRLVNADSVKRSTLMKIFKEGSEEGKAIDELVLNPEKLKRKKKISRI